MFIAAIPSFPAAHLPETETKRARKCIHFVRIKRTPELFDAPSPVELELSIFRTNQDAPLFSFHYALSDR